MTSIQFSLNDTQTLLKFCRVVLTQKNDNIDQWSIQAIKEEAAKLLGYGGSSGKNIFSAGKSRPPIPEDKFISFCSKFFAYPEIDSTVIKAFSVWKKDIEMRYAQSHKSMNETNIQIDNENYQSLTVKIGNKDGSWKIPIEVLNAYNTLTNYYNNLQVYQGVLAEINIYFELKKIIEKRISSFARDKDEVKAFWFQARDLLLSETGWLWFERKKNKIIRKGVRFADFTSHQEEGIIYPDFYFDEIDNGKRSALLEWIQVDIDNDYMRITNIDRGDPPLVQCTNIEFAILSLSDFLIGHRLSVDPGSGHLDGDLIVIQKNSEDKNIDIPSYKELSLNHNSIPPFVRSVLCSPVDAGIPINPYANIFNTLVHLSLNVKETITLVSGDNGPKAISVKKKRI